MVVHAEDRSGISRRRSREKVTVLRRDPEDLSGAGGFQTAARDSILRDRQEAIMCEVMGLRLLMAGGSDKGQGGSGEQRLRLDA